MYSNHVGDREFAQNMTQVSEGYLLAREKGYRAYILRSGDTYELVTTEAVFAFFFRYVEALFSRKEILFRDRAILQECIDTVTYLKGLDGDWESSIEKMQSCAFRLENPVDRKVI